MPRHTLPLVGGSVTYVDAISAGRQMTRHAESTASAQLFALVRAPPDRRPAARRLNTSVRSGGCYIVTVAQISSGTPRLIACQLPGFKMCSDDAERCCIVLTLLPVTKKIMLPTYW